MSIRSYVDDDAKIFFLKDNLVVSSKDNKLKKYHRQDGAWHRLWIDIAIFEDYSHENDYQSII